MMTANSLDWSKLLTVKNGFRFNHKFGPACRVRCRDEAFYTVKSRGGDTVWV